MNEFLCRFLSIYHEQRKTYLDEKQQLLKGLTQKWQKLLDQVVL